MSNLVASPPPPFAEGRKNTANAIEIHYLKAIALGTCADLIANKEFDETNLG